MNRLLPAYYRSRPTPLRDSKTSAVCDWRTRCTQHRASRRIEQKSRCKYLTRIVPRADRESCWQPGSRRRRQFDSATEQPHQSATDRRWRRLAGILHPACRTPRNQTLSQLVIFSLWCFRTQLLPIGWTNEKRALWPALVRVESSIALRVPRVSTDSTSCPAPACKSRTEGGKFQSYGTYNNCNLPLEVKRSKVNVTRSQKDRTCVWTCGKNTQPRTNRLSSHNRFRTSSRSDS